VEQEQQEQQDQQQEQEQEREREQEQEQEQEQGHIELVGGASLSEARLMMGPGAGVAGEAVLLGPAAAADVGGAGPKLIRVLRRAASPDPPQGGSGGDACDSGAVDKEASGSPAVNVLGITC
jgi:hypothetical protein